MYCFVSVCSEMVVQFTTNNYELVAMTKFNNLFRNPQKVVFKHCPWFG